MLFRGKRGGSSSGRGRGRGRGASSSSTSTPPGGAYGAPTVSFGAPTASGVPIATYDGSSLPPRSSSSSSSGDEDGPDDDVDVSVDVHKLSHHELRILESALRVQLEVGKIALKKNVRRTVALSLVVGVVMPIGIVSIIKEKKTAKKYKQLAEHATAELASRRLQRAILDAEERAVVAVAYSGDNAGCALSFAPKILLDLKVLHAVCETFMINEGNFLEPHHTIIKVKPTITETAKNFVGQMWSKDTQPKDPNAIETIEMFGEPGTGLPVRRQATHAYPMAAPVPSQAAVAPSAPAV